MTAAAVVVDASVSDPFAAQYAGIDRYYTTKVERFGASPFGVDWACAPSQHLRFLQLLKLVRPLRSFSINDLGCGYGALSGFLRERYPEAEIDYLGIDVSAEMVRRAKRASRSHTNARFVVGHRSPRIADYSLASGIFNVIPPGCRTGWEALVAATLATLAETSRHGFAVNFLRSPTGAPAPSLYGASVDVWSRFCRDHLRCDIDVVDDYGLREFTLIARTRLSQ